MSAQPVELAKAALFLVSEGGSFMTGSDMVVDGGVSNVSDGRHPSRPASAAQDRPPCGDHGAIVFSRSRTMAIWLRKRYMMLSFALIVAELLTSRLRNDQGLLGPDRDLIALKLGDCGKDMELNLVACGLSQAMKVAFHQRGNEGDLRTTWMFEMGPILESLACG